MGAFASGIVSGAPLQVPSGKRAVITVGLQNNAGMTGDYRISGALLRSGTSTVAAVLFGDANAQSQAATGSIGASQSTTARLYSASPLPDSQTLGSALDLQITVSSQTLQENVTYVVPGAVVPATMGPPTSVQTGNITSDSFDVSFTPDPLAQRTAILHTDASGTVLSTLGSAPSSPAQVTGLSAGAQEHFALMSVDAQGHQSALTQVYVITTVGASAPSGLRVVGVTSGSITLAWSAQTADEFQVFRMANGQPQALLADGINGNSTGVQVTGLSPNVTYALALRSLLGGAYSPFSRTVTATTPTQSTTPYHYVNPMCETLFTQEQAVMSEIRQAQYELQQMYLAESVPTNTTVTSAMIFAQRDKIATLTTDLQQISAQMATAGCF